MFPTKLSSFVPALVIIGIALLVFHSTTNAQPQEATPINQLGRYQMSTFAYPGVHTSGESSYGVYIIDNTTGEVWISHKSNTPRKIGKVGH